MGTSARKRYFYISKGGYLGPVSAERLRGLAGSGELLPTDLVFEDGAALGVPAAQLKWLFAAAKPAGPRPIPTAKPAPPRPAIHVPPPPPDPDEEPEPPPARPAIHVPPPPVLDVPPDPDDEVPVLPGSDAFISYSSRDKPTADAICAALEQARVRCWIAPRDIRPGVNYGEGIIDGINSSRLLVVVLSSASNVSPQVLREVERGVHKGLPIIPFRIEDVKPSKSMEYFLSTPHWLDALTGPVEAHINKLVPVVRAVLNPDHEAPPPPRRGGAGPQTAYGTGRRRSRLWVRLGVLAACLLMAVGVGLWFGVPALRHRAHDRELARLNTASDTACRAGKYAEAVKLADQAIAADPAAALGYARRGRARYFQGDEHTALADFDTALSKDPNLAVALAYRATVAGLAGPADAAVADAERALTLDPKLPDGPACLALARLRAGDAKAAAAMEAAPNSPEAQRARGLALAELGDASALAAFDAAVEASGGQAVYLAARAEHLVLLSAAGPQAGEAALLARAQADVDRALAADPACAAAWVARANVHAARGRWPDVIDACEQAVAANPRLVSAYLRAADNLSPRAARRYRMLQAALMLPIDLRELKGGGDFTFRELLTEIQKLVSAQMKEDVVLFIDVDTFLEDTRLTIRDHRIEINNLMDASGERLLPRITLKTVLTDFCRQVGATVWVTPDDIRIVDLGSAPETARNTPRLTPPTLIEDVAVAVRRYRQFEEALEQTSDFRGVDAGGEFSFGAFVQEFQRFMSTQMKADLPIFIDYRSFPADQRAAVRDKQVNLNSLLDVRGERLVPGLTFRRVLSAVCKQVVAEVRSTPDYILISYAMPEIFGGIGDPGPLSLWDQLRAAIAGNPFGFPIEPRYAAAGRRPEAMAWLRRGMEVVPESAELHVARAQLYLEQAEFHLALTDLAEAIQLRPGYAEAIRLKALATGAKGKQLPEPDDGLVAAPPVRRPGDALAGRPRAGPAA